MKNKKPWKSRYVFYIRQVDEKCPKCGASKLIHYAWNDLTDDAGHYRACLNKNCTFDQLVGDLADPCSICNFSGSESPHGLIQIKLICPNKVAQG